MGSAAFYVDVPLSPDAATTLQVTAGSFNQSQDITWTPTVLAGSKTMVVRPGDSLLVQASQTGIWRVSLNCGLYQAEAPIAAGDKAPVLFPTSGTYIIESLDANGAVTGTITVSVPGLDFGSYIACEVNFQRVKDMTFNTVADKSLVTLLCPDGWIQVGKGTSPTGADPRLQRMTIKPLLASTSVLIARVNGPTGPVMSQQTIRPFYIWTTASKVIGVAERYSDSSRLCSAELIMSPQLLPGLDVYMYAFVAGVTFEDSTTEHWFKSADFYQGSEGFGHLPYFLIRAPAVHTGICHAWQTFQDGIAISR
jgi:hypothetical protein